MTAMTPVARAWFWVLTVLGAVCMVGTSAWALWSDNPWWLVLFASLAAVFLLAAVLVPVAVALREQFAGGGASSSRRRRRRT